jgi:CARDB
VQAADGRWAINIQDGSTGNHVVNNILLTLHSFRGVIDISSDSLPGFVSDSNAVTGRFTTNGGNSILTLAAWRTATGQDTHSFTTTPADVFVNVAAGDYHIGASSPARDTAMVPTDVTTDFEGLARPSGPASDIGADEYHVVTLPPPPPPPAPADLVETSVSNPPARVRRGGHFTVTDTVKNQGGTVAGPSVTTYFLSADPVKSATDRALDGRRRVSALGAGASSTGSVSVRVPAGTPRGTYFLLACTDQTLTVSESSDSNNCRAAMASVIVQ